MMKRKSVVLAGLSASVYAVLATGCGGGGGGGDNAPTTDPTTQVATVAEQSTLPATNTVGSTTGNVEIEQAVTAPVTVAEVPTWLEFDATAISDFTNISRWSYFDLKVPAAQKGAVAQVQGLTAAATRLNFDLSCGSANIQPAVASSLCGGSAGMQLALAQPMAVDSTSSLSMAVRNPGTSTVIEVSVKDGTGQTLFYRFDPRTIERKGGSDWNTILIPLNAPTGFYGGANDGIPHDQISLVKVAAGTGEVTYPADTIEVDDLKVVKSPRFSFSLPANPVMAPGTFLPNYDGRLGVVAHQLQVAALDKAKSVGISFVRKDIKWANVEINQTLNWSEYNPYVKALSDRGLGILPVVAGSHPAFGGGTPPTTGYQRNGYANFAQRVATYLKGKGIKVMGYELWNEPDASYSWASPDPVAYASLFEEAASRIRTVDTTTPIASAGLGIENMKRLGFLQKMTATGKLGAADGISIHPYRSAKPESFAADAAPINRVLANAGLNNKALWVTEWSYSSYGHFNAGVYGNGHDARAENRQAVLTLRGILTQLAMNIPRMVVYDLVNNGTNPTDREHNFGLLRADLTEKPVMGGLRTLNEHAKTRVFKGYASEVPPSTHLLQWESSTDRVFAIWVDTPGVTLQVKMPAGKTVSGRYWNNSDVAGIQNGIALTEAMGPIFVTIKK